MELLQGNRSPTLARRGAMESAGSKRLCSHWKESQLPARELGLQLLFHGGEKVPINWRARLKRRLRRVALLSPWRQARFSGSYQKQIADLAAKNRLPAIYNREDLCRPAADLMSYGPDRTEPYRRAAVFVDRDPLREPSPADISSRATNKVRADHKPQSGEADRPDDSAQRAGAGRSSDQVKKNRNRRGERARREQKNA